MRPGAELLERARPPPKNPLVVLCMANPDAVADESADALEEGVDPGPEQRPQDLGVEAGGSQASR